MPSIRYPLSAFIVAVAVLIQISLIFRASLVLPPDQYDLTQACVTSTKGGKMSGDYKVLCTVGYPCPTYRDCEVGRSGVCSISDPCTPCSDFPGYPDPGCTLCAESPTYGDCGFVEGYGCVISPTKARQRMRVIRRILKSMHFSMTVSHTAARPTPQRTPPPSLQSLL
jgi:hypothetical protein